VGVQAVRQDETFEERPVYEAPRIEDYGTLAELTAGDKEGNDWDVVSFQYGHGGDGGYS
jgi:hypothetical protein